MLIMTFIFEFNLINLLMELTNTLLIKFALVAQIILALYFLISRALKFILKLDFDALANLFYKFQHFINFKFLLLNPIQRFFNKSFVVPWF